MNSKNVLIMWLNHGSQRSFQPMISTTLLIDTDYFHSRTMPMTNSDSDDDMHVQHKLEGYEKECEVLVVCIYCPSIMCN
jgi:hypothetical protein